MKKFRPYCAGYILLYVLALLSIVDAGYSLITSISGTANQYLQSFSIFSYLIAAVAIVYVYMYASSKIVIGDHQMRFVYVAYIRPEAGQKRAMILYRSGDTDAHKIDKRVDLGELEKYGWIEDLGYSRLDKSGATEKNKLFPVHEIALVMKDHRRYHINLAIYSDKQRREIIKALRDECGFAPEGKLNELLG